jgi:signal transduction histidine kinase
MKLLPSELPTRLAAALLLVLLASLALFALLWRAQLNESTAPQLAQALSANIAGLRTVLSALPPPQRAAWIARNAADNQLRLKPIADTQPAPEPTQRFFRRLRTELRAAAGADVALSATRRPPELHIDFSVQDQRYRLSLPATRFGRVSERPFFWLLVGLGLALWVAIVLVIWQVNRPLQRMAETLAGRSGGLGEIALPASAPREFQVFAERFNRLAHQLAAQERERELLLASVSHDLRAPLTRIRMRAEMLDDAEAGAALARDTESMRRIIDQFLDYQRPPRPAVRVDLARLLREAAAQQLRLGRQVRVESAGEAAIDVDPTALERMLDNLIDNALVHGREPVELTSRIERGSALIEVRDHGPGIPADQRERVLQPFERLDTARSAQGHCGLGLAVVQRLAAQNGASLELDGAPGGGLLARLRFAPSAARPAHA